MPHSLLTRLASGHRLSGMQCFSASPILVEAMGHAGLDFTIIDLEHCPTTLETAALLCRAADAAQITPFVRIPRMDPLLIGQVLDLGAHGVVIPHASPAVAREAVRASRLVPEGSRGACPIVRASKYGATPWAEFVAEQRERNLIIPLIEDIVAVEAAPDILDVEGIDIVFVGPFDLAISAGMPGKDFRAPQMARLLEKVVHSATQRGKHVMTTVGATIDETYAEQLLHMGVSVLSFSADVGVFLAASKRIALLAGKHSDRYKR